MIGARIEYNEPCGKTDTGALHSGSDSNLVPLLFPYLCSLCILKSGVPQGSKEAAPLLPTLGDQLSNTEHLNYINDVGRLYKPVVLKL